MIKLKKTFNNNTVYYTIINKNKINFKITKKSNERLETLQSRYVLNCMLNYFNIKKSTICKTKLGKPYFKDKNIFFNYSHSNNFIACAISNYDVGIDIEETNRVINDTMIKICHFDKEKKLEELVKREAFCKLTGEGIAMFFNKNNFKNIEKNSITIKNKDYICSICSNCSKPSFQYIDIKEKNNI